MRSPGRARARTSHLGQKNRAVLALRAGGWATETLGVGQPIRPNEPPAVEQPRGALLDGVSGSVGEGLLQKRRRMVGMEALREDTL